jgi:hypothetical protein
VSRIDLPSIKKLMSSEINKESNTTEEITQVIDALVSGHDGIPLPPVVKRVMF